MLVIGVAFDKDFLHLKSAIPAVSSAANINASGFLIFTHLSTKLRRMCVRFPVAGRIVRNAAWMRTGGYG